MNENVILEGDEAIAAIEALADRMDAAGVTDEDALAAKGRTAQQLREYAQRWGLSAQVDPTLIGEMERLCGQFEAVKAQAARQAAQKAPRKAKAPPQAASAPGASTGAASAKPGVQFQLTIIQTSDGTRLSKRHYLDACGALAKEQGGQMRAGVARRIATDIAGLAAAIPRMTPDTALVFGVSNTPDGNDTVNTVAQATDAARAADPSLITRSQRDLKWPSGHGGLLIDTDSPKKPGAAPLTRQQITDQLETLCPQIKKAPRLTYDSSSGWVFDAATGAQLIGQRGIHNVLLVKDASHIPEAAQVLHLRAVARGLGWLEVGRAGQMLVRSCVDRVAAAGPERLVFSAGAECAQGLEQRRPAPNVFNAAAQPLDTRAHLKLTTKLKNDAQKLVDEMARSPDFLAEQERVRALCLAAYVQGRMDELIRRRTAAQMPALTAEEEQQARRQFETQHEHTHASTVHTVTGTKADMQGDQPIVLASGVEVTVDDILAHPDTYDGQRCHDPLEPDYGGGDKRIATIHAKPSQGGQPHIYSHAHGGWKFYLRQSAQGVFKALAAAKAPAPSAAAPAAAAAAAAPAAAAQRSLKAHALASDLANAARLYERLGDRVMSAHGYGLLAYDGTRWVRDKLAAQREAHQLSRIIDTEIAALSQQQLAVVDPSANKVIADKIATLIKARMDAESRRSIDAAITILEREMHRRVEFDADPWFFNVRNGTLDLRTGQLRAHSPGDHLTQIAGVSFDPHATAPRWVKFIEEITCGDAALAEFLQMESGYALTGLIDEQKLIIPWGEGRNGKSTFYDIRAELMGDYYATISPELFDTRAKLSDERLGAQLVGKRLAVASEPDEGLRLKEGTVKAVTGDRMGAFRFLYAEKSEARRTAKLTVVANHRPSIAGADEGIWRRILLVPYTAVFDGAQRDLQLGEKLRAELPGILNWMLEGVRKWRAAGRLPDVPSIVSATADYRAAEDRVAQFVDEELVVEAGASASLKELHEAYVGWCKGANYAPLGRNRFAAQLEKTLRARGVAKGRNTANGTAFLGVRLPKVSWVNPPA